MGGSISKADLEAATNAYNDALASIKLEDVNVAEISEQINSLKQCWETDGSAETIGQLEAKCQDLEQKVEQLKGFVDTIQANPVEFTITPESTGKERVSNGAPVAASGGYYGGKGYGSWQ